MAINGLTERRRLPRAGKIRLGEKRISQKSGNPYPAATDYFVWPDEYKEALTELFGEKAREMDIMFPTEDLEQISPQYLRRYGTSGLLCRGDGVMAECVNQETGEWVEIECNPEECPYFSPSDPSKKSCRQVLNLRFIIPQLISEGVWQLDTSSYNSIIAVNSAIDYIRGLIGRVSMIPLRLRVIPREVQPDGKKKIVYVLDLKLGAQLGLRELQALAQAGDRPLLALPSLDDHVPPDDLFPVEASSFANSNEEQEEEVETSPDLAGDLEAKEETPSQLDSDIADLVAELRLKPAQVTLRWKKVQGDKEAMLELLTAEYDSNGKQPGESPKPSNPEAHTPPSRPDSTPSPPAASKKTGWLI
ncbi:MAG: hypothetical protein WC683_09690 [bacterium]